MLTCLLQKPRKTHLCDVGMVPNPPGEPQPPRRVWAGLCCSLQARRSSTCLCKAPASENASPETRDSSVPSAPRKAMPTTDLPFKTPPAEGASDCPAPAGTALTGGPRARAAGWLWPREPNRRSEGGWAEQPGGARLLCPSAEAGVPLHDPPFWVPLGPLPGPRD